MLFNKKDYIINERSNMYDAPGTISLNKVTEDCPPNSRLIAEVVINPGSGIGVHTHENEAEMYFMLEGELVLTDDGKEYPFKVGQSHICYSGHSHGAMNNTDKPALMLAVIITDK